MKNKTIKDIMICPECGSDDCYEYNTDEISFDNEISSGHCYVDCCCNNCNNDFRLCFDFGYNITKSWVRS